MDELPVHYRSNTEGQTTTDRGGNPTHVTQQGQHRTRLYNQYKIHHKNKKHMKTSSQVRCVAELQAAGGAQEVFSS